MQHGSESRISTKIYGLRSEQKRTFFNKKANRARKDLTFVPGNEIMDLNNERRGKYERACKTGILDNGRRVVLYFF